MPVHTNRTSLALPRVATAAITALLLLTGCSGQAQQDEKRQEVASLPPSASSSDSPSASGPGASAPDSASDGSSGVQLRLDDTPEKRLQLRKILAACLEKNGMGEGANSQVSDTVRRKAEEACKDKMPINPPELDPAKNPHYSEDVVDMVKCLTSHGIPAVIEPATDSRPVSWTLTSGNVPDDYDQANAACMMKSFDPRS